MPDPSAFIPIAPLHWTTIAHYIILLGSLLSLILAGDDSSILYLLTAAVLALVAGADLYAGLLGLNRLEIGRLVIFLLRVFMFGIPALIAGLASDEGTRNIGIAMALVALPLLIITMVTCPLGSPLGDPRIMNWCSNIAR